MIVRHLDNLEADYRWVYPDADLDDCYIYEDCIEWCTESFIELCNEECDDGYLLANDGINGIMYVIEGEQFEGSSEEWFEALSDENKELALFNIDEWKR